MRHLGDLLPVERLIAKLLPQFLGGRMIEAERLPALKHRGMPGACFDSCHLSMIGKPFSFIFRNVTGFSSLIYSGSKAPSPINLCRVLPTSNCLHHTTLSLQSSHLPLPNRAETPFSGCLGASLKDVDDPV